MSPTDAGTRKTGSCNGPGYVSTYSKNYTYCDHLVNINSRLAQSELAMRSTGKEGTSAAFSGLPRTSEDKLQTTYGSDYKVPEVVEELEPKLLEDGFPMRQQLRVRIKKPSQEIASQPPPAPESPIIPPSTYLSSTEIVGAIKKTQAICNRLIPRKKLKWARKHTHSKHDMTQERNLKDYMKDHGLELLFTADRKPSSKNTSKKSSEETIESTGKGLVAPYATNRVGFDSDVDLVSNISDENERIVPPAEFLNTSSPSRCGKKQFRGKKSSWNPVNFSITSSTESSSYISDGSNNVVGFKNLLTQEHNLLRNSDKKIHCRMLSKPLVLKHAKAAVYPRPMTPAPFPKW